MAYTDDEIRRQFRLGEDSAWEFKSVDLRNSDPARHQRDGWADEIAAFANARGGVLLDTSHRTYLYASNIAINGGQQQPVSFVPGEEDLHLTDADGKSLLVRVVAIAGRSSVLDYGPV